MSFSPQNSVDLSLARLLGAGGETVPKERYQQPTLQQTKRGVWFIRPWVDVVTPDGVIRQKKTVPIGAMGKREATKKAGEVMQTINRADYVVTSQIIFGRFLEEYERLHVDRLAASTQGKYRSHLKNHIRPAFAEMMMCEVGNTLHVQKWLDAKTLSWAAKTDIRNILSSIFTKAIEWGRWKDRNPIEAVHAGRKRAAREKQKLTDEQTRRLLAALPPDVRLLCCVCLFGTLRISEAFGVQEKHLDFERGLIQIRQRFYRGDLDVTKNEAAIRDVPMGYLVDDLKRIVMGDPERFVFQVKTRPEWGRRESACRDDRDIHQHFVRPAAVALGFYWPGFGWHSLRREAVTALGSILGTNATMRLAGHSSADMGLLYTLPDQQAQDAAIRARQEAIIGKTGEKVN
jgi:integrase